MRLPALTTAAVLWALYRMWWDPTGLQPSDLGLVAFGYLASGAVGWGRRGGPLGSRLLRLRRGIGERMLGRVTRAPWIAMITFAPILAVAYALYGPLTELDTFVRTGDWPVNAAFARAAYEAIARGRPLTWATEISSGEPIFDLYPTFVHRLLAWIAYAFGDVRSIVPLMGAAVAASFIAVAIGVARAAARLGAPWPAAAIAGVAVLLDSGSDFSWGIRATFHWGFFPSTCAIAVAMFTLPAVLDLAERRGSVVRVALGVGLAAVMHPVGVVLGGALLVGTLVAWTFPGRLGPRGPERALLGVGLGIALTAPAWASASARIVAYGVHYGTPVLQLGDTIDRMVHGRLPDGDFGPFVILGWFVCVASLFDRDPRRRILGGAALFLVMLCAETIFNDLGFAPSATSVRWQAYRVSTFAKPLLYVTGAVGLGSLAHLRPFARDARVLLVFRAACVGLGLYWLATTPSIEAEVTTVRAQVEGRRGLVHSSAPTFASELEQIAGVLARERAGIDAPHARVLLWCPTQCSYVALETMRAAGLSTLIMHVAPAGFFLRDQFHSATPENMRRFGIRWIVGRRVEPPPSPRAVQPVPGEYIIADNPTWDGEIAHVVDGPGAVHTRVVPGEGFDLTLEGAPTGLVELGTPYYPRLHATHGGTDVPIEALLVDGPEHEHALRLRLPEGVTHVRADARVPSDLAGWPLTLLALVGIGLALVARRPRGERIRRFVVEAAPALRRWGRRAAWASVLLVPAVLVLATGEWTGRARSVRFGPLFPYAQVSIEGPGGAMTECESIDLGRRRRCPDHTVIEMSTLHRLSDWHVGWPAPTPAITVRGGHTVRLVISIPVRLEGDYLGVCSGCTAELDGDQGVVQRFDGNTTRVHLAPLSPLRFHMTAAPDGAFSLIDAAVLDPPFVYPLARSPD